ncbi:MAG: asparagine synthase (glutamine-hydrolyzing) [Nitrospira sp.]|nr:asparagine synthase (glutamine-hydrolyzing) [Nitrospira sp.]
MCGIVGVVHAEPGFADQPLVKRMCALITRRGPDDDGFYFGDRVGLGMRRLAIIDVHSGKQPIHNEDRTVWVVFNGEIYNYRELREQLEKQGHRLATSSDTECLVHLYEEYGEGFLDHLRGMFAFAIWDDRHKKLLLGRDRLGIKPLYYSKHKEALYFGSELKCLLPIENFRRQINLRALSDYLTLKYVPGPHTIYEDIHEIPPGHVGIWNSGIFNLRRYWQLKPGTESEKSIEYYAEGLLHHLEEAVRLHLVSEVPLGAFLSGGIDSSAIVALMARAGQGKVKTFTIGFEDGQAGTDERPFARAVAGRYGTDHSEYLYEDPQAQIEEMLPAIIQSFDEPFADSSVIPNYMISMAARKYVTVALSGTGGDELFAGYERYRGALAAEQYRRIPKALRRDVFDRLIHRLPEISAAGPWIDRVKRFVEGADLPLPQRYQRYLAAFDEREKTELFSQEVLESLKASENYSTPIAMERITACGDLLDWMLLADMETYLPDDELRKTDRLSMWHSLEVRVPFLDHKVVEFAAAIPSKYKLKGWEKKHILIKSLTGLLPNSILNRRKQGFSIPLSQWLRGPLRDLVRNHLDPSSIRASGLFNARAVDKLIDEHERSLRNHETRIWTLLVLMAWRQEYMNPT